MRLQIKIGSVREPVQFLLPKWEIKFEIYRSLGIVSAIGIRYFQLVHTSTFNPHRIVEGMHTGPPLLKCLFPSIWANKVFNLHLLKFSRTKNKIARRNLVSKCFPDLRDSKRELGMKRINHIFEIHEYAARRLGAQVCG